LFRPHGKIMLKKDILRRKDDFNSIYKKGKSVGDRYFVIFYKENRLSYNRIAFLASKKVGNSVERNRARRLMKENFRILKHQIMEGYDLIFIARNTINDVKSYDTEKSMKNALRRARLLINSSGERNA